MRVLLSILLLYPMLVLGDRGLSPLTVFYKDSERVGASLAGKMQLYTNSHALVIGIDRYSNGWTPLDNAIVDAERVASALDERGFEVTLLKDLDEESLDQAFEDFFIDKGADPNARLFVWFAGHGHTIDGEAYLIPADGVSDQDIREFRRRAISLRRFSDYIRQADAKHVFVVFDSCFAGTIFDIARSRPPPAITRVTAEPVRQFLTSGDEGQTVADDGEFARLFVEAINGERRADLNDDGYVTAGELGSFLTASVSNYTYNKQVPRYGKLQDPRYDKGDFVFRNPAVDQVQDAERLQACEDSARMAALVDGARQFAELVDGARQFAEIVGGVQISSKTKIVDMMVEGNSTTSEVDFQLTPELSILGVTTVEDMMVTMDTALVFHRDSRIPMAIVENMTTAYSAIDSKTLTEQLTQAGYGVGYTNLEKDGSYLLAEVEVSRAIYEDKPDRISSTGMGFAECH